MRRKSNIMILINVMLFNNINVYNNESNNKNEDEDDFFGQMLFIDKQPETYVLMLLFIAHMPGN